MPMIIALLMVDAMIRAMAVSGRVGYNDCCVDIKNDYDEHGDDVDNDGDDDGGDASCIL